MKLGVAVAPDLEVPTPTYWLQSVLFLAGVTLSAAMIQRRFSRGTLISKLDRLWQAGVAAVSHDVVPLKVLDLCSQVRNLANLLETEPFYLLLCLKDCFYAALRAIAKKVPVEAKMFSEVKLDSSLAAKFGFRDMLIEALGKTVRCMIVYGSSVTSDFFADYDVILVVNDRERALRILADRSPSYRGVELNVSVFDPQEFWTYQVLSGDNLTHHGLCLKGEILIPLKASGDLVARNFSFGFIRLRQIIGMRHPAHSTSSDSPHANKSNLYGYFAKIPLNVARGILGALGTQVTKEGLTKWAEDTLPYSPERNVCRINCGDQQGAMANAAWATNRTLAYFNDLYRVCV